MKRVVNINWFDVWSALIDGKTVFCYEGDVSNPMRLLNFLYVEGIKTLIEKCRTGEDVVFLCIEDGEE